jgi:hypothetical protein
MRITCYNAGIVAAEFRLNGWAYFCRELPGNACRIRLVLIPTARSASRGICCKSLTIQGSPISNSHETHALDWCTECKRL